MAIPGRLNPLLFKPIRVGTSTITKGSLISFTYSNWKHDPTPLVIVTDLISGDRIRGLNLHYLTFNNIQRILQTYCDNAAFSYRDVMADSYVVGAFRHYKTQGIRGPRKLDCEFILRVMKMVRSFDPSEVAKIEETVEQQLREQVNLTAEEHRGV